MVKQLKQSLDIQIKAMRLEWINNSRYQGQNDSDQYRATVEQEDTAIVTAVATAPD